MITSDKVLHEIALRAVQLSEASGMYREHALTMVAEALDEDVRLSYHPYHAHMCLVLNVCDAILERLPLNSHADAHAHVLTIMEGF